VLTVTIPTPESRDAVRRALRAAVERGSALLGVVENMAGPPFAGDAGDALAAEFGIPLLARLPFHPDAGAWSTLGAHSAFRIPHSAS
jgi:Mrp family chromosome partitioning ATPase